jgi:hypothetical protein
MFGERTLNLANPVNRAAPLNRGLVGWWLTLPQRSSGNRWLSLNNKNHGTRVAAPLMSGLSPPGLSCSTSFNGTTQYIDLPANFGLFGGSAPWTMAVWFYANSSGGGEMIWHPRGERDVFLRLQSSTSVECAWYDSSTKSAANTYLGLKTWNHIIYVWDVANSLVRTYLNGVTGTTVATGTPASRSDKSTFATQYYGGTPNASFSGLLQDARLYNRALSERDSKELYRASRTGYQRELNWLDRPWLMGVPAAVGGNRRRRVLLGSH